MSPEMRAWLLRLAEAVEKVYWDTRGPQSGNRIAEELREICETQPHD